MKNNFHSYLQWVDIPITINAKVILKKNKT